MKITKVLTMAAVAVLLALPIASSARADGEQPTVSVDFRDATIRQVVDQLCVKAGVNVVIENQIGGKVNLRLSDVAWLKALRLAAKQVGCDVTEADDGIYYVTTPHFSFTTKAEGVSLKQVISMLARQSGRNVIVSPDVEAVVHLHLEDVPWQDALETIVKTAGPFSVVKNESGVYRVVRSDALEEQKETRVFKLKYIQPPSEYKPKISNEFAEKREGQSEGAAELKEQFTLFKALDQVVGEKGSVEYDFDSNAFIVTTTRPLLDEIAEIIELVDVKPAQVFVDVKFVTTAHTDLLNAGVRYPQGFKITGSGGSVVHKLPFNLGKGGFEDAISVTGDGPTPDDVADFLDDESPYTFGVLDFSNIAPVLEFLSNDNESEIVQAPQLTVVDNKAATVFVGEQIHFAEEFTTTNQGGQLSRGIREAQQNSPVKVGTQLMVMPHIVPESDKIVLSVIPTSEQLTGSSSPEITGFERFSVGESTIDLPRLSSRTILTTLILKDGQTAVLGGLINQNRSHNRTKIPFFGDIPIVGWLFKNKQIANDINNLYIFISVRIIRDDQDMESLFAEYSVPGATAKPYKRGMKVKSIEDELKEIREKEKAEEAAKAKEEQPEQLEKPQEEEQPAPRTEPGAQPEPSQPAEEPEVTTLRSPERDSDVVGRGWEETEHGVEEFEITQ